MFLDSLNIRTIQQLFEERRLSSSILSLTHTLDHIHIILNMPKHLANTFLGLEFLALLRADKMAKLCDKL